MQIIFFTQAGKLSLQKKVVSQLTYHFKLVKLITNTISE